MIVIDGSAGEGGGQILRTSLALSLITGKTFKIEKIRAGRAKPGLLRQHLTAVNAAAEVGQADVAGASLGSKELTFIPGKIKSGTYAFAVGTAGSATLVLQTVLPALFLAETSSTLTLEGGTHNPFAPPFDFLKKTFLPLVNRMGPTITVKLERPGFYPAGGGRFSVQIEPTEKLTGFELIERGEILAQRAKALVASLPPSIADRELTVIARKMSWEREQLRSEVIKNAHGPGNIVTIEIESQHLTEVFTGFGEKGVPAETVAEQAMKAAREYLASNVPVGEYLADQLLMPLALAGQGSFVTTRPSDHTTTNIEVLKKFLEIEIRISQKTKHAWTLKIG